MTNNEDVICVDVVPFDERIPIEQLKGLAKKWFKTKYITRDKDGRIRSLTIRNWDTDKDIEITGEGIGHAISVARNIDVIYAMDALPEMIERMKYSHSLPPKEIEDGKKPDRNFLGVEIYHTHVRVRGTLYNAELVVKVREWGGKKTRKITKLSYYNHKFM